MNRLRPFKHKLKMFILGKNKGKQQHNIGDKAYIHTYIVWHHEYFFLLIFLYVAVVIFAIGVTKTITEFPNEYIFFIVSFGFFLYIFVVAAYTSVWMCLIPSPKVCMHVCVCAGKEQFAVGKFTFRCMHLCWAIEARGKKGKIQNEVFYILLLGLCINMRNVKM